MAAIMHKRLTTPYALLIPGMLLLSVFLIVPSLYGFWLSLHEFDGLNVGAWSGLSQYHAVLRDPEFRSSFWHTLVFAIIVIGKNVVGPVLYVSTLLALMGAFVRSFDVLWVLTRGGFGTDVVVTHMYNEAFQFSRFGRAAAMGYLLFAIIAVIAFAFIFISKRSGRDD